MCANSGYLYVGQNGAGHYVKMVHNAIEYGMMQSMGEGFQLLEQGPFKGLDYRKIAHLWNNGSIVRSFLMEMAENAFSKDSRLEKLSGYVEDTGEGKWSIQEAIDLNVPFTAISHALYQRYRSRCNDPFSDRLIAALRNEFGAHKIKKR